MLEAISWGDYSIFVNHTVIQDLSVFSGNFLHKEQVTQRLKSSRRCSMSFIARCTWKPCDRRAENWMYCELPVETDWLPTWLAPCRYQLYWRRAEQHSRKSIATSKNCLFVNDEPWAFSIFHVREHDVNTTVPQQEAADKTWWTISSSWPPARYNVLVYVALWEAEVTNRNHLFGSFSLSFISHTVLSYCQYIFYF